MRTGWSLAALWLSAAGTLLAQASDATKLLADVQQALGGSAALAAITSIDVQGKALRTTLDLCASGDFEMSIALPGRYTRRDMAAQFAGGPVYRLSGFDGDTFIHDVQAPPDQRARKGAVRTFVEGPTSPSGEKAALLRVRQDFARMALGFLPQSLSAYPLSFSPGGRVVLASGAADVLEVTGEDGFAARLFIDGATHLPVMLTWMARQPVVITNAGEPRRRSGGGTLIPTPGPWDGGPGGYVAHFPEGPVGRAPKPQSTTPFANDETPEERNARAPLVVRTLPWTAANPNAVEHRLIYADYRPVDGVRVPHRLLRSVDGHQVEEITIDKVKLGRRPSG